MLGGRFEIQTAQPHLLGLFTWLAHRQHAAWHRAIVLFGQGAHLRNVNIASDHQDRIGGHVPAPVKIARILRRHGLQVTHPAHNRPPVRRGYEHRGIECLVQKRVRIVFGTKPSLLLDHFQFLLEFFIRPLVVGKAIRFELHHIFQPVRGNLLEVAGVILARESILPPAQRRHLARKFTRFHNFRTLEQHVFEHMRHARSAVHFIH